ncbi:hypothetical protein O181_033489 [Austropuccinia psidii MF-1]|uniref:Uncharacterized protein n=1 Tax=Austropuccinia psidii MF-1 TaxID=1389203 RepID=A0A9Q3CZA8_9BASI|nr:hypothetical protein [Austropuccinia psidii MF-1]
MLQTLICHLYTSETLESQGTSQRKEKACPEPEDLEEDTLDTGVYGKTLREIIPTLPFTFQFNRNLKPEEWKDMEPVLQVNQILKDLFQWSMDKKRFNQHPTGKNLEQEVQTPEGEGNQAKGESSHYPSYRRTAEPDRAYSYSYRPTRSRPNMPSSGFTPFRYQQISDQQSPFFTIPDSLQEKARTQGQKQDLFQSRAERVRPNDPEAVGLGERSTQKPEIVVTTSIISSPTKRNITPA